MNTFENIPKKNCFKTPGDYFEESKKQILLKTVDKKQRRTLNTSYELFKPYVYLAAGMLFLVIIIRLGLEIGIGDYKQQKHHQIQLVHEDSYEDKLYDFILSDKNFIMTYLFDDENGSFNDNPIDLEYLEDYLAQYIYNFDLYQ